MTIQSIVSNIFTDISLPESNSYVSAADVRRYLYEACQKFNNLTLCLRGSAVIQAVAAQTDYDLPDDFRCNLFTVEYDFTPLFPRSKVFLDTYDSDWRDPAHLAELDATPLFYTTHLVEIGKFVVFPPPSVAGEAVDLRGSSGGIKRSVTIGTTTADTRGSSGGIERSLSFDDESFDLRGSRGGLVRDITPRAGNFYIEYIREPATFSDTGDLDTQLEKYSDILEAYVRWRIFRKNTPIQDPEAATREWKYFEEGVIITKRNLMRAHPRRPASIRPAFRRSNLGNRATFV